MPLSAPDDIICPTSTGGASPGVRLGPYEIESALGAGGMGEVWRARDTTLGRDVALKILPDHLALDPDRLARFKREAQILASLNHPNIGAIHVFQESDGVQALVLELVEGPTLADRIAQGPIPVDEALNWIFLTTTAATPLFGFQESLSLWRLPQVQSGGPSHPQIQRLDRREA